MDSIAWKQNANSAQSVSAVLVKFSCTNGGIFTLHVKMAPPATFCFEVPID